MTPIIIRTEEAVKQYNIRKNKVSHAHVLDNGVDLKDWPHPADAVKIIETKDYKDSTVQAYTDGSKYEQGVGSGVAIFIGEKVAAQTKYKLDSRCSKNQAEQLAIVKALEAIDSIHITGNSQRTATIFTDSKITLDSLLNAKNHAYLIEEIRKKVATLTSLEWKLEFSWVKAHRGIHGNERADRLAKEAAQSKITNIAFSRIPKSTLYYEAEEEAKQKWQKEWEKCPNAAITKQYFPTVQDRLNITPIIAAMVTGHGKTRAYLHRFKLLESATCACNTGEQTIDHLLYQCTLLHTQRNILKKNTLKTGKWPASKKELITKHQGPFLNFINSIDFEQL
jgi:ribonuclease HI